MRNGLLIVSVLLILSSASAQLPPLPQDPPLAQQEREMRRGNRKAVTTITREENRIIGGRSAATPKPETALHPEQQRILDTVARLKREPQILEAARRADAERVARDQRAAFLKRRHELASPRHKNQS